MKKRFLVKRRVLFAVVGVLIPVTILFAGIIRAAILQIEHQIAQANRSSLQIYHNLLQKEISSTERFMNNLVYSSEIYDVFSSATAQDSAYSSQVREQLYDHFEKNQDISAFLICRPSSDLFHEEFNSSSGYGNTESAMAEIAAHVLDDQKDSPLGWFLVQSHQQTFLCRAMEKNKTYLMAIINLEQAVKNSVLLYGQKGNIVFYQRNRILANETFVKDTAIPLRYFSDKDYYFSGGGKKYMVVQEHMLNFKMALILPFQKEDGFIGLLYLSPYLYALVIALTLALVVWYLRITLFFPLDNLVRTMQRIQDGDLNARLAEQSGDEFSKVQVTFNSMVSELASLRIKSYEQ